MLFYRWLDISVSTWRYKYLAQGRNSAYTGCCTEVEDVTMPELEGRQVTAATVITYLRGIAFPATKGEIVYCAEENHAPESLLDLLEQLPDWDYWDEEDIGDGLENIRH